VREAAAFTGTERGDTADTADTADQAELAEQSYAYIAVLQQARTLLELKASYTSSLRPHMVTWRRYCSSGVCCRMLSYADVC
jgi:hypothetical protein